MAGRGYGPNYFKSLALTVIDKNLRLLFWFKHLICGKLYSSCSVNVELVELRQMRMDRKDRMILGRIMIWSYS